MGTAKYLSTKELAERIGVPVETVRYWRKRERGPKAKKFEGQVRYALDEIERWEADPVTYQRARELEIVINREAS